MLLRSNERNKKTRHQKAVLMEPDRTQQPSASPVVPKTDLEVPTPASRGLCDKCARLNWRLLLQRHFGDWPRNALDRHEEALIAEAHTRWEELGSAHADGSRSVVNLDVLGLRAGVGVVESPYGGSYEVTRTGEIHFDWSKRTIAEDSLVDCSVCRLLAITAREKGLALPIECQVYVYFRLIQGYEPNILYFNCSWEKDADGGWFDQQLTLPNWSKGDFQRIPPDPRLIHPSLLSQWNSTCKTQHGEVCQVKPGSRPESMPFRLVDVTLDRVVPAPSLCDYVALSYVWGNISPYTLRQSEVQYHSPHNRIFDESYTVLDRDALPQTIRDAMFVVACLGERYLWVDSLCIVQDDVDDLNQNLRQMHRIYSGATLTIVAANGEDADFGLSGLYAGSRDITPFEFNIDTVKLVRTEPEYPHGGTAWRRRSWTYQEYHFSKRCLIFENQRVYFECPSGRRGEAMPNYLSQPSLHVAHGAVPPLFSKVSYHAEHISALDGHRQHVSNYTGRHLTYEHDVLNAFAAIMNEYEERHGVKFCWGLPRDQFANSLLWTREKQLRRRKMNQDGTSFPSWSWAGWVGEVTYSFFMRDVPDISSAITWPWEDVYNIASTSDVTDFGILSIRAELASVRFDPASVSPSHTLCCFDERDRLYWFDLQYDEEMKCKEEEEEEDERHQCMLLGDVEASDDDYKYFFGKEAHISALILEQHKNGMFYRKGVFFLQREKWEALKPIEQVIRLG